MLSARLCSVFVIYGEAVSMKKADLITSIIFAFISVLIIAASFRLPAAQNGVPGPGTWPLIIAVLMLAASFTIMIKALKKSAREDEPVDMVSADLLRVYIVMGLLIIYLPAMYVLGFCTATALMLFLFIKRFGNYKWYKTVCISAVLTLAVYGIFKYILKVPFRFGFLV